MLPHLDAAYNLARWITGDNQDAEDVVEEAYLRAFRAFDNFSEVNSIGWLLTIVRNSSYSLLKNKHGHRNVITFDEVAHSQAVDPAADDTQSFQQTPDSILDDSTNYMLVHNALQELPAIFREVIVLREFEGLTYKEIAEIIEVPPGTVMSRLSRGRKYLQQALCALSKKEIRSEL
jgi:RNA polymerase sigma-70 factor (ECF subfamily)